MFAMLKIVHNIILRNNKHSSIAITNIIILLYAVVKITDSKSVNRSQQ